MLRMHPGCPVMMTGNADVENNMANGSQGNIRKVVSKHGHSCHMRKINGMSVRCVCASQVRHVAWDMGGGVVKAIEPRILKTLKANFPLPEEFCCCPKDTARIYLRATQIPLTSNDATTGFGLQGASLGSTYVPSWSHTLDWPYVLLSRVETLDGLSLGRPTERSEGFESPHQLTVMLETLRLTSSPSESDIDDLDIDKETASLLKKMNNKQCSHLASLRTSFLISRTAAADAESSHCRVLHGSARRGAGKFTVPPKAHD